MGERERRKVQGLICEAFREAGVLAVVLSALDATFSTAPYPKLLLAEWTLTGIFFLVGGIIFDPEVRR